jgi:hypothetical protein
LDEDEVVSFINRVSRYALNEEKNPQAVDIQELVKSVNAGGFSDEQYRVWCERIVDTYEAQRETVIGMLHGIYCDPDKGEDVRVNAITICRHLKEKFTPRINSLLINRHQNYQAKGETERHKASQLFFEGLGLLTLLSETERHAMISQACKSLLSVHDAFYNFYNEPPFAERLMNLTSERAVPATAQAEFVEAVVTCGVGNQYGISRAAEGYYVQMIQGFSPREIQIMLELPESKAIVSRRMKSSNRCKTQFIFLVQQLKAESIPTSLKSLYEKWIKP